MSDVREQWALAFLRQGRSDLAVYDLLISRPETEIPRCHALHYLQMACEKIAKAYRVRDTTAELHGEGGLLRKHVGFEKFIGAFLLSPTIKAAYAKRDAQLQAVAKNVRALAREIEKLAPAVDAEAAPENTEYPWEFAGQIVAPCTYEFPRLSFLREPHGRTFLKLLRQSLDEFDKST